MMLVEAVAMSSRGETMLTGEGELLTSSVPVRPVTTTSLSVALASFMVKSIWLVVRRSTSRMMVW